MAVRYEWKYGRGGSRRFVRTVVPDEAPVPVIVPEPETVTDVAADWTIEEEPKPKRKYTRKVVDADE